MRRIMLPLVTLLFLGMCATALAAEGRRDMGTYSVGEAFANWTVERQDGLDTFTSPEGEGDRKFYISVQKAGKGADLAAIARTEVGETPVTMGEDGKSFLYEDAAGNRGWYILTDDGTLVGLSVEGAYDGAGMFIAELEAAEGQTALEQAFAAADADDNVVQWLRGLAVLPDDGEVINWWGEYCAGEKCFSINNYRAGTEGYYFRFSFTVKDKETGDGMAEVEGRSAGSEGLLFTLSEDDDTLTVALDPDVELAGENAWMKDVAGDYPRK